jgi:protein translocase SecG subunit
MSSFFIGLLEVVLWFNCALLILLVLVQLPKKDAGAGMAFGAGTADALFGAGSGNALTKITKWAAGVFLGLCLLLGHIEISANAGDNGDALKKEMSAQQHAAQQAPASANHLQQFTPTSMTPATNPVSAAPTAPAAPVSTAK